MNQAEAFEAAKELPWAEFVAMSALRARSWWRTIAREAQEQIVADSRKIREQAAALERHASAAMRDGALLAEAYALLHDERHKGRQDNQKTWQADRGEWDRKFREVER